MKTRILFLVVLAVIAISAGVSRPVIFSVHTYWADGGAPMPPPLPIRPTAISAASSESRYLADGGAPMPPPLPIKPTAVSAVSSESRYLADGGAPMPPPSPVKPTIAA